MDSVPDPFREQRKENGILECEFQGETVPMTLRHEAVRRAAKDWMTFSSDGASREAKGSSLEAYLSEKFDEATAHPGDDFCSALTRARFRGQPLTREEMMGFANLTFAGGRDTVIHWISSVIAYLAKHPQALEYLREDSSRIVLAGEEFFRAFMPLTHIGRFCPVEPDVHGFTVRPGGRVSLCWKSANQDSSVFDSPGEVRLDRKPLPPPVLRLRAASLPGRTPCAGAAPKFVVETHAARPKHLLAFHRRKNREDRRIRAPGRL